MDVFAVVGAFIVALIAVSIIVIFFKAIAGFFKVIFSLFKSDLEYVYIDKNGTPYCLYCNRQISFKNNYCQSCGKRFLLSGEEKEQAIKERNIKVIAQDQESHLLPIVGEASYIDNLVEILGVNKRSRFTEKKFPCYIEYDNNNAFDKNAIVVKINRKIVGYFSREEAARFRRNSKEATFIAEAIVKGCYSEDHRKFMIGVFIDTTTFEKVAEHRLSKEEIEEAERQYLRKKAEDEARHTEQMRKKAEEAVEQARRKQERDEYYRSKGIEPGPWAWFHDLPEYVQPILIGLLVGLPGILIVLLFVLFRR